MSIITSIKRKIEFAATIAREPRLLYYRFKAQMLSTRKTNLDVPHTTEVYNIIENGLSRIILSDKNIRGNSLH